LNQPRLQDLIHIEAAAANKAAEAADAKKAAKDAAAKETGAAMHDFCGVIGVFFELRGNVPKWRRFLADNPSFIFYCCLIVYVLYIYPRCLCIAAQCLSSSDNDTEFQRCMSII